jgi:hypothetical protein
MRSREVDSILLLLAGLLEVTVTASHFLSQRGLTLLGATAGCDRTVTLLDMLISLRGAELLAMCALSWAVVGRGP